MFDVVALGELLIDFTPAGISNAGNELFERNPGGAPANVLAAVRKLGKSAAFLGMVGNDRFGLYLNSVLSDHGIDTAGLVFSKDANTTLAFVHLDSKGDRSFSFFRKPGADMMLDVKDVNYQVIRESNIFHFGSLSMTHEPARSATISAVRYAKKNGLLVSYDPNLRPPLWSSLEDAKREMLTGMEYADILKISETEVEFLTGTASLEKGTETLHKMGVDTIFATLGPKGCFYSYIGGSGYVPTYDTRIVDTTGAGDAFMGGVLWQLSGKRKEDIKNLPDEDFKSIVDFANAVGALAASKRGAIPSMPGLDEVCECQRNIPKLVVQD